MAKQARTDDVSFIEKHVEKGVLLLCIVGLLLSVWYWGLSSPRRVPMHRPGAPGAKIEVSPDQADATLKKEAERLKGAHEDEKPTVTPLPSLQPELDALRARPFEGGKMIAWGLPRKELVPEAEGTIGPEGEFGMKVRVAELQKLLPAPAVPVATVNAEVVDNGPEPFEGFAAHPVSTYALTELTALWQKKLKYLSLKDNPITIVGVEIEVKVADDVNADWASLAAVRLNDQRLPITMMTGNQQTVIEKLPQLPPATNAEGLEAVLADVDLIAVNMEELLQPRYYSLLDAMGLTWVSWYKNLPREPIAKAGGEITETIRTLQAAPGAGGGPGRLPAERGTRGRRPPTGREIDGPMQDGGPVRGRASRGVPSRGVPSRGEDPRGAVRPAPRPVGPRPTDAVRGPGPGEGDGANIVEREIAPPGFGQQQTAGTFLIWFHDMTLQAGKAYRYRIRLKILNPLLGNEHLLHKDDKSEAWITSMHTPWSDFSAPVWAVRKIDFFLVDSKRDGLTPPKSKTGKIKVAVFTRRLGQLVRQEFTVTKGQPIGGPQDVKLRKPPVSQHTPPEAGAAASEETHSVRKVNFSTGAVVINIDFLKRIFPAGQKRNTTEVVFVDGAGRLRSRLWMRNLPKASQEVERFNGLNAEIAGTAPQEVAETDEKARQ